MNNAGIGFLDAGCCFWETYNSCYEIYREDIIDCPVHDKSDRVKALTINSAIVYSLNDSGIKLKIVLENKHKIVVWSEDIESESNLSIISIAT